MCKKRILSLTIITLFISSLLMPFFPFVALGIPNISIVSGWQSYTPGEEIVELRDQYSRTHMGENGNFILTSYMGSIHYETDNGGFQPIDTTITSSRKTGWDWEVETGHWQLYIKNDTTVGVKKGNNWIGHRLHGIAYLDISTKEYTILQTTTSGIAPIVNGNSIEWVEILYGVDFRLYYKNDSLKEDIVVKQKLRNLLNSDGYRPADFGLNTATTYLVPIFEVDWSQSLPMKLRSGVAVNPDEAEHEATIYFESPVRDRYFNTKLVSFMPLDYAVSVNPINPEDPEADWEYASEPIRRRLIKKNDKHWLLMGVRVTTLNQMPEGDIVFDPTETLRPDGAGDETNIDVQFPAATFHWDKVDEVVADNLTTYVRSHNAAYLRDLYNVANSGVGAGIINSITVHARSKGHINATYQNSLKIAIKSNATVTEDEKLITASWADYSKAWATNPADSEAWEWADIDTLQIGIALRTCEVGVANPSYCTQIFVEVHYTTASPPVVVYRYRATYTVTSENTSDFEMLGVHTDNAVANQWMADNGFISSNARDTRIETLGGLEKPHMITDNATFTAIPVPAGSQTNLYFTTGNSEEDFEIIPGYGGYVTVADNTTIELGDNFTVEQSGWWDTSYELTFVWVSADNGADEGATWNNIPNALDGDNSTFAHSGIGAGVWGSFLDLNISSDNTSPSMINSIRYWATQAALGDGLDLMDVDLYSNGIWTGVYHGVATNSVLTTTTIAVSPDQRATAARVRFHNSSGGAQSPRLHIFEFSAADYGYAIYKPDAFEIYNSGSGNITAQIFGSSANVTATGVASEHIVKTDEQPVLSLDGDNDYVEFPNNVAYDIDAASGTGMTIMFWGDMVTPTGGSSTHIIVGRQPGNFTENAIGIHNATGVILVRPSAGGGATIDIDDYAGWHLFTFLFSTDMETSTIYVDTTLRSEVDAGAEFTWNNNNALHIGNSLGTRTCEGLFGEVWFYNRILDPSEIEDVYNGVPSSTGLVGYWKLNDGAGTKVKDFSATANDGTLTGASWGNEFLRIYVDDVLEDLDDGAAVSDNTSDWVFMRNNIIPYSDNTSLEVDGALELWFRPNDIISGTTLPDRATSVANDGTFTWGANPQGVSVIMGGLVSGAQPSPGETVDDPPPDIMPGVEVTDWYIEPDVTGALLTNPMRPFVTIMSDTTTLTELQAWRLLGTALVLMVAVGTIRAVRGHLGIASMATGAIILGMVVWTIYPMWALVLAVVMFIAGLIAERSPSL